ncbi:MAG: hypothetical protein HQK64_01310 [Desulfamplus sp.]|nr:hypothetical protein [Desulfamplus sp.]MBF0388820.1 hypothetical protein [Desulfamplus sp.]
MRYTVCTILILSLSILPLIGFGCGKKGDPTPAFSSAFSPTFSNLTTISKSNLN